MNMLTTKLKVFWEDTKAFFLYSKSVFLARMTVVSGFLISASGLIDWSPLLSLVGVDTGFSRHQLFWTGAVVAIKGVFDELARRINPNNQFKN